jgi:hypothetical protein
LMPCPMTSLHGLWFMVGYAGSVNTIH